MTETNEQRMTRVRSHLLQDQPWWGVRAMHLRMVPSEQFPRGGTDGSKLIYNPTWVGSEPEWVVRFFVAHEVDHCALGHMWRRGDRDPIEWNICTDFSINISLKDAGFRVPDNVYIDERYRGWYPEAIYAYRQNQRMLEQEQQQQQQQNQGQDQRQSQGQGQRQEGSNQDNSRKPGSGSPSDAPSDQQQVLLGPDGQTPCPTGQFVDAPKPSGDGDGTEESVTQAEWQVASEQAMRVAMKAGKLPVGVQSLMETEIRSTRTDWTAQLQEFFQRLNPTSFSWSRPSRRAPKGMTLPGVVRDELGQIILAVDTSGSIGQHIYKAFVDNVSHIVTEVQPKEVLFIQADAAIQSVEEFDPGEPVTIRRHGYGGTRFRPVFDWVESEGHHPAALIYLTDLECYDMNGENGPSYPVLWATPEWIKTEGPFGRTIRVQISR